LALEETNRVEHPCMCGISTYTEIVSMDEWGRTQISMIMNCEICLKDYRLEKTISYDKALPIKKGKWVKKKKYKK